VSRIDTRAVQGEIARKALHLGVGLPVALLALGLLLRSQFEFLATPVLSEEKLRFLGYGLIGVIAVTYLAGYLAKRRILSGAGLRDRLSSRPEQFGATLSEALFPLFFLAAAPALVGLIFYFLGGDLDTYVLISVFCPAGLMLLKPTESEIERLDQEVFGGEE
jgi:hypothetical protein